MFCVKRRKRGLYFSGCFTEFGRLSQQLFVRVVHYSGLVEKAPLRRGMWAARHSEGFSTLPVQLVILMMLWMACMTEAVEQVRS